MRKALFVLAALSWSAQSAAAPQWCGGQITHMLVQHDGYLQVIPAFRGDWIALCNVTIAYNGISPETCRSWQASVTTAIAGKLGTVIHFDNAPACTSVPIYFAAPKVSYVWINN